MLYVIPTELNLADLLRISIAMIEAQKSARKAAEAKCIRFPSSAKRIEA